MIQPSPAAAKGFAASATAPTPAPTPVTVAPPASAPPEITCQWATDTAPENARKDPTFAETQSRPPTPLTPRQLLAVDLLLAARSHAEVCKKLKLNAKTLYNWRHHNPLFIAELHRRSHAAWQDTADRLRALVTRGLDTLAHQLGGLASDATQLRAARALIYLVVNNRLAPTGPTNVDEILDQFLAAAEPPKATTATPAYTQAQRQQMLENLLADSADHDDPSCRVGSAHYPSIQAPNSQDPVSGRTEGAPSSSPDTPPI